MDGRRARRSCCEGVTGQEGNRCAEHPEHKLQAHLLGTTLRGGRTREQVPRTPNPPPQPRTTATITIRESANPRITKPAFILCTAGVEDPYSALPITPSAFVDLIQPSSPVKQASPFFSFQVIDIEV